MKRLTENDKQGNWRLTGAAWRELQKKLNHELREKLYGVLWKLMEYEESGLSPEEIGQLKEFKGNNLQKYLVELAEHRWIPEEERLPGERGIYLAAAENEGFLCRIIGYCNAPGWTGENSRQKLIAWQSVPGTYRLGKDGEEDARP